MCLFFVNSIQAVRKYKAGPRIASVRSSIGDLTSEAVRIDLEVDIANPLPFALRQAEIEMYLSVEQAVMQHVVAEINSELSRDSITTVRLHVDVEMATIAGMCPSLLQADSIPYELSGVLTASPLHRTLPIPLHHQGVIPVLSLPKVEDISVHMFRAGPNKGSVSAEVELSNPNCFTAGVEGLRFELVSDTHRIKDLRAVSCDAIRRGDKQWVALQGDLSAALALARALDEVRHPKFSVVISGPVRTPFSEPPVVEPLPTHKLEATDENQPGHYSGK